MKTRAAAQAFWRKLSLTAFASLSVMVAHSGAADAAEYILLFNWQDSPESQAVYATRVSTDDPSLVKLPKNPEDLPLARIDATYSWESCLKKAYFSLNGQRAQEVAKSAAKTSAATAVMAGTAGELGIGSCGIPPLGVAGAIAGATLAVVSAASFCVGAGAQAVAWVDEAYAEKGLAHHKNTLATSGGTLVYFPKRWSGEADPDHNPRFLKTFENCLKSPPGISTR